MNFEDTTEAFKLKSTKELKLSYLLFWLMSKPTLVKYLSEITKLLLQLKLPIKWIIKGTIYKQFCGGENVGEFNDVIQNLGRSNIGTILDYSVEGEDSEEGFELTKNELIKIVTLSALNDNIPCACMKMTGIGSSIFMEKLQKGLVHKDDFEYQSLRNKLDQICMIATQNQTPIYIDAEESWIQGTIDDLCEEMMLKYNKDKAIVFTTLQMYRRDRLDYFDQLLHKMRAKQTFIGVKIVRGAYLEKENNLALEKGVMSPINKNKQATDQLYNLALKKAVENIDLVEICAGTHNEDSCNLLIDLMKKNNIPNDDNRIWFSQLFGMSDHISYNLSKEKFNVSKYLPYGPVESTMPYLIRRAKENTAIAGQMGQEFKILKKELQRRKLSSS